MAHTDIAALLALASQRAAQPCGVETTLSVIEGRWKLLILFQLLGGTKRFGELKKRLSGVTQRMLTLHLRELERDGLIHREVYRRCPQGGILADPDGTFAGTAAAHHERVGAWPSRLAGRGVATGGGIGSGRPISVMAGVPAFRGARRSTDDRDTGHDGEIRYSNLRCDGWGIAVRSQYSSGGGDRHAFIRLPESEPQRGGIVSPAYAGDERANNSPLM